MEEVLRLAELEEQGEVTTDGINCTKVAAEISELPRNGTSDLADEDGDVDLAPDEDAMGGTNEIGTLKSHLPKTESTAGDKRDQGQKNASKTLPSETTTSVENTEATKLYARFHRSFQAGTTQASRPL